jgi:hypothetical protein
MNQQLRTFVEVTITDLYSALQAGNIGSAKLKFGTLVGVAVSMNTEAVYALHSIASTVSGMTEREEIASAISVVTDYLP